MRTQLEKGTHTVTAGGYNSEGVHKVTQGIVDASLHWHI